MIDQLAFYMENCNLLLFKFYLPNSLLSVDGRGIWFGTGVRERHS